MEYVTKEVEWNTKGAYDNKSKRERLWNSPSAPSDEFFYPPINHQHLIRYFWDIRAMTGVIDNIVSMSIIRDWQDHTGVTLDRWERDAVFEMDRAFRSAHHNVVKYHADVDRRNEERKNKRGRR